MGVLLSVQSRHKAHSYKPENTSNSSESHLSHCWFPLHTFLRIPAGSPQFIDSQPYNLYNVTLMIGEFEYLLIAATLRLGEEAYGASIRREVEEATERPCSIGSLYTTLDRLEAKGLVTTWMGEATAQRGGRAKRMVSVTAKGVESASAFYRAISRVSRDISWEAR